MSKLVSPSFGQSFRTLKSNFRRARIVSLAPSEGERVGVRGALLLVIVACLLSGCGRDGIKVYRVSKEEPTSPQAPVAPAPDSSMPPGHPPVSGMHSAAQSKITYTRPEGWQEMGAGQMSRASFLITNEAGLQGQITITPLPGLEGKEVPIVNMWRQQVGLPELSDEDAEKELKPVEIGGQPGKMFDVTGRSDSGAAMRIVTAIVSRDGVSWFYKFIGDDALVEAQKPSFVAFLNSVKITDEPVADAGLPAMGGGAGESAPGEMASQFHWTVPDGWRAEVAGQMQIARFSVPSVGPATAEVMVSVFPSSTGGTLANVNRWRRQIELGPVGEAELPGMVNVVDASLPDSILVDITGGKKQLIGAIVARNGQWFFYKIVGDPAAVAPQKDAFVAFVKSEP